MLDKFILYLICNRLKIKTLFIIIVIIIIIIIIIILFFKSLSLSKL